LHPGAVTAYGRKESCSEITHREKILHRLAIETVYLSRRRNLQLFFFVLLLRLRRLSSLPTTELLTPHTRISINVRIFVVAYLASCSTTRPFRLL
jgi:hypothetical protein